MAELAKYDQELWHWIEEEDRRQLEKIELIASENFVSPRVLQAAGTCLTNKYAEGYPGQRYYGGCEYIDKVEDLARERVKKLFNAGYANVQPHSGSQANMAVYFALVPPGGNILGMDLTHGGHLTHGSSVNFSGKLYNFYHYGVTRDEEIIDYIQVEELALKYKPDMIVAGCSAYSRIIDFKRFREIADKVGAYLVVDMAHFAGLVAAGLYPNPLEEAHVVTSTTHKTLRGPRGGLILTDEAELARRIDKAVFPGVQGGPLEHIIAAKAVAFKEALQPEFKEYSRQIIANAHCLSEELSKTGLRIVSGGTDSHCFLVDLTPIDLTGKKAEELLDSVGITVNKNTIPFEEKSPFITSGIRIGTPAVTTRGMKEEEMIVIASLIKRTFDSRNSEEKLKLISEDILSLTANFQKHKTI